MNKSQAIQHFWEQFRLPTYDENTVPDDAPFPYITYNTVMDSLDGVVNLYGNLWHRSTSWKDISLMAQTISDTITRGGNVLPVDGGYLWIQRGTPFAQRMTDESDDMIRRVYINLQAEFLTAN